MRVAIVVPGFSQDADDWAIPALQHLALGLADEHDIEIFSLRYPAAGRYQLGGLRHQATGGGQRSGLASVSIWWQTVAAIRRRHRQAPFDILHAFWADEPGLVAGLAGRWLHRPVLTSIGGGELTYFPEFNYGTQGSDVRRAIVRLALSAAGVVTAGSQYQCALAVRHGVAQEKLRLISLGVDLHQFQPHLTPDWQRPTLIQAASLTPVKNQALMLEVMGRVQLQRPEIRLIVVGSGPMADSLRTMAAEMGLAGAVTWQPAVLHPRMPNFYHQGHLYVQSSLHESQGVSVLEALACGLPVLGTPVGLMAEIATRPASLSPEVLADQIVAILANRETYESLRALSRQLAEDRFSLRQTVAHLGQIYQELARN